MGKENSYQRQKIYPLQTNLIFTTIDTRLLDYKWQTFALNQTPATDNMSSTHFIFIMTDAVF